MSSIYGQELRNSLLMESTFSSREKTLQEISLLAEAESMNTISLAVRDIWSRVMNWNGSHPLTEGLTTEQLQACRSNLISYYVDGVVDELMQTDAVRCKLIGFALRKQRLDLGLENRESIQVLLKALESTGKSHEEWIALWNKKVQTRVEEKFKQIEEDARREWTSQAPAAQEEAPKGGCCAIV